MSGGHPEASDELGDLDLEQASDHLYGLPISEFTRARNSLAKQEKAKGHDDDARSVAALTKPVLAAWAINQLARRHGSELEKFVEVTTAAEVAKDAAALRAIGRERRQVIAHLVAGAKRILEEGDHAASATTLERISRTLQASSVEGRRSTLLAGRLTRDLEPGGMDFLAALPETDITSSQSDADGSERRLIMEQMSRRVEEAGQHATELTRAAEAAETKARELAEQAAEARREARRVREEAAHLARRGR